MKHTLSIIIFGLGLCFPVSAWADVTPSLDAGLVGHWTFNGKDMFPNVRDSSGQGNHGNLVGYVATTSVAGKVGQALSFNGNAQIVNLGSGSSINIQTFTYCLWVRPSTLNAGGLIGGSVAGGPVFQIRDAGNVLAFDKEGATVIRTTTASVPLASWSHVCLSYSATGVYSFYLNGIVVDTGTNLQTFTFASLRLGDDHNSFYFHGDMDDVRIYNRVLAAAEVKQLYTANAGTITQNVAVPSLTSGLVGYWTLDADKTVSNIVDSSGQGHDGVLIGGATTSVSGKNKEALKFNGSTQYIDTGVRLGSLASGDGTQCIWAYHKNAYNAGVDEELMGSGNPGAGNNFNFVHYSDNNLYLGFDTGGNRVVVTATPANWPVNKWTHYCLTWVSGGAMTAYINAVPIGTKSSISVTNPPSSIRIGYHVYSGSFYNGKLDEARVYNRALSAAEITQLYGYSSSKVNQTVSNTSLDSSLVGHWTFDGKDMKPNIRDTSGQGNHGNLVGYTATTSVAGKVGQALSFNGTSQYVSVPDASSLRPSGGISVATWFKQRTQKSVGLATSVVGKWYLGGVRGYSIETYDVNSFGTCNGLGAKILFHIETDSPGNDSCLSSGVTAVNNQWYFVVGTYSSSTGLTSIYVNGILSNSTTAFTGALHGPASPLGIGAMNDNGVWSSFFDGTVDDVRIYNRDLSQAEVKKLYSASSAKMN